MANTCRWILEPHPNARYCGAPVGYTMAPDDDGTRRRKYDPFCAQHAARAAEQDQQEDE